MPPGAARDVQKRPYPPFNPPRPKNAANTTTATASGSKSKSKPNASTSESSTSNRKRQSRPRSPSVDLELEDSNDDEAGSQADSSVRSLSPFQEPDYILAEITAPATTSGDREAIDSADPAIPPKLLTRILHHHFQSDKTKIAKDANRVVAKYVDIFVREALARAAYERQEGNKQAEAAGGRRGLADGFLEVEDLEKLAPQMVLDF
ncbi:hypothetical protein FQN54_001289 [Arachnomyces sp. PD_36]|nr:hypothetical protein FQN54_001289 [Arachnomyces sp. PD_36]